MQDWEDRQRKRDIAKLEAHECYGKPRMPTGDAYDHGVVYAPPEARAEIEATDNVVAIDELKGCGFFVVV